ncbi:hypothetical protein Pint_29225 [Pistacia integerrima]|uniref:Uncharacterized protein n=1 Tax=Pistacia integerrima TaxID=434235 RepID=A0ACC0X1M6_9ROSI|nr:hypothetical protein Pint_29225 [Pistacia integerrima]
MNLQTSVFFKSSLLNQVGLLQISFSQLRFSQSSLKFPPNSMVRYLFLSLNKCISTVHIPSRHKSITSFTSTHRPASVSLRTQSNQPDLSDLSPSFDSTIDFFALQARGRHPHSQTQLTNKP